MILRAWDFLKLHQLFESLLQQLLPFLVPELQIRKLTDHVRKPLLVQNLDALSNLLDDQLAEREELPQIHNTFGRCIEPIALL